MALKPGITGANTIARADDWVSSSVAGIYNVPPEQITEGLNAAVKKGLDKVATECTRGGKGSAERQAR